VHRVSIVRDRARLPWWEHQAHLIARLYRDLVAHRRTVAADGIGEEAQRRRAENEIRRNRESRGGVPRCVAEAHALAASNRVYRHVGEPLILDADTRPGLWHRRRPLFRPAARGERETECHDDEMAPCEHRLLRNGLCPTNR